MQVRRGGGVFIPASSPLRGRIGVAQVATYGAGRRLTAPAQVEANPSHTVNVLPPLTGRLVDLKVELGDIVRRGQLLALISAPDLAQARADAERAADGLSLARKALDRSRSVGEAGANAGKDREAAESAFNQAQAEDRRARERLTTLSGPSGGDGGLLAVTAPIAGAVTALNVGRGTFINDATAPLLTVADLGQVWITAQVPENQVRAITRGQAADVELDAYPGQVLHGKVQSISPVLDPDSRRVKVRLEFPNADGRLKPNMFATASFAVSEPGRVVVPSSALLMNNDSISVFVETEPWSFVRRAVEIGSEDGDRVSIVRGLKGGERVIVRGGILLND